MNILAIKIEPSPVASGQFLEGILASAAKKETERGLLRNFLLSPSLSGTPRIEEIIISATSQVASKEIDLKVTKPQAVNYYVTQARVQKTTQGVSVYQDLILATIEAGDSFHHQQLARKIRQGFVPVSLPPDYPGEFKRAQILVDGQFSSSVGEKEIRQHLIRINIRSTIHRLTTDMFYGINHELSPDQAIQLLAVVYELDKIKTADPISRSILLETVTDAIAYNVSIPLVHIKSLRFTYPGGQRLRVIEDTASLIQSGQPGETRTYPSEDVIFARLGQAREIFAAYGISSQVTVIVSDHDLDYCFPSQQNIVPTSDVIAAKHSATRYVKYLRHHHPQVEHIQTLTEFLAEKQATDKFTQMFNVLVFQGQGGGGQHLSEKILEMRVSDQFEHYSQMFETYTRDLARYTAIRQIANVLSLSAVFEAFPTRPILVIDSRGLEDQLIGGLNPKSVAKVFIKLKDPTQVINVKI